MLTRNILPAAAVLLSGVIAATAATAQKSKDTVNIATNEFMAALDYYHEPTTEVILPVRNVYGWLLTFNEHTGKFVPELATSWKRVDSTTLQFELRDDVKFHNGNPFTGDDVKATIDYLKDPKVRLRFKGRYNWVKEVKVLNPHRIQIISKKPFPTDLHTIAYRFYIYDAETLNSLDNKSEYGRKSAAGTNVYRAVSIDRNKGFLLERDDAAVKKFPHRSANIKRIQTTPMSDKQTQVAALLTGQIHAIRAITADMGKQLATVPNMVIHPVTSKDMQYLVLDAKGRSDNKIFTDKRLRVALFKAIPREKIIKTFIAGENLAERPKGVCFAQLVGCDTSTDVIAYDPEGAKKLMAEAGHPNGFKFTITTNTNYKQIAEAVAGELRKVGIIAEIQTPAPATSRKMRGQGKLTLYLSSYPTFSQPTMTNSMNFFFAGSRDYNGDPIIAKALKSGRGELNLAKRTEIYRQAVDQVNKEAYVYPLSERPTVWAHSNKVQVMKGKTNISMVVVGDWAWK